MNKKIIPISIIVAGILIVGALLFINQEKIKEMTSGKASADAIANEAIKYINENLIAPGVVASLVNVTDTGSVYKIHLKVEQEGNSLGEFDSYVTKDGQLLFPEGYDMKQSLAQENNETPTEVPKTDTPDVKLFVMSFCPFGNQAEDTMLPVYNLLKDKVNWSIHYIVADNNGTISSLHGQAEVDEDQREECILKESGMDKWWQFVAYVNANCGSDGVCWQEAATNAGVDVSTINNCVSSQGLSLLKDEAAASNEAGVSGSPTLIINGVESESVYQYGKPQAYLDAICSAFNSAPAECSQQLAALNTTSSGGSCGQ